MYKIETFQDLRVWQKAHTLILEIYKLTKCFPSDEKFGIISQIRRSSVSIATNIVEGQKRKSTKDYLHFLNLSNSSLEETKYLLLLSKDLNYINYEHYEALIHYCSEIGRMLAGLRKSLSLTP